MYNIDRKVSIKRQLYILLVQKDTNITLNYICLNYIIKHNFDGFLQQ